MRNAVQLITYADRLAGDLPGLARLLGSPPWSDAFGGVHVLPFFTPFDGADAGFDPIDHTQVDPRLGSWDDVRTLGRDRDTVVDLIVNHVSASSAQFQDVVAKGETSPYAPMFLTLGSVFPAGATEADLTRIYRPRPGLPFTHRTLGGTPRLVWTTFTSEQIDIDVRSAPGRAYLADVLDALVAAGVSMVRLDAVGYAVKTAGTSCFMTDETFEFIDELTAQARARGVDVLVEVHGHHAQQVQVARRVDRVYDFALPPLVLHALYTGDGGPLARWMQMRPSNAVTVLDTHDGIGIVDVGPDPNDPARAGLLTGDQLAQLVTTLHHRTGGTSVAATGAAAANLDLYQVNSTFYDAVGRDDRAYLLARAVQLFTPGIPQVYYVGALAGGNDLELLARTGVGREINRHRYTDAELANELARPVVRSLFALASFRSRLPAFDGDFTFSADERARVLTYSWRAAESSATLVADLPAGSARVDWTWHARRGTSSDLLADPPRP